MSVLIKGMEMPENTIFCPCMNGEYGDCQVPGVNKCYGIGNDGCPLVPVPPHGRTIDADALIEDLKYDVELDAVALDSMEIAGDERRRIQDDKDCKQNCIFWIENAPTIIPAEEG